MNEKTSPFDEKPSAFEHKRLLDELIGRSLASAAPSEKAELHVRLAALRRGAFLDGVGALKDYQEAFKLDPSRVDALQRAREIYRDIGRLPLVHKLLNLEISAAESEEDLQALYRELGDVLLDLGDIENAALAYSEALQHGAAVSDLLEDSQVDESTYRERADELLERAGAVKSVRPRQELLIRAAGVLRRFEPERGDALLLEAYRLDPRHARAASLVENAYLEREAAEELCEIQRELVAGSTEPRALSLTIGSRWAQRHLPEFAVEFLLEALRAPGAPICVSTYLIEAAGDDPERLRKYLQAVEAGLDQIGPSSSYHVASAAGVLAGLLGDRGAARKFLTRLRELSPDHPLLAELGEADQPQPTALSESKMSTEEFEKMDATDNEAPEIEETSDVAANTPASASVPPAADEGKIAQLRQKLATVEARPHEYIKVLVELADAVGEPVEKAALLRQVGELYSGKFGNHAEAVKAYEKLVAIEPGDDAAKAYLREMYEKRRDWDSLIALMKRDAEAMDTASDRADAYRAIAMMATEKVKKPQVCIELWQEVLESEPGDTGALVALVDLHEKGRNYEALCDVLEKVIEVTFDPTERVNYLNKLGQTAGDRLKDEVRAAEAYRQLLAITPDDKRAQEQLKKRYVTLGRWDDLEVFYTESQNWDEFIRLLESNEPKAESDEQRISMLHKIAELWLTQKGKPDRASRALEKILTLDERNVLAAERLMPIYEDTKNSKGLVKAIEVKLASVEEVAERLELLGRLAKLYEDALRDKKSALGHLLEAVSLAPESAEVLDAAERVAKAAGGFDDLVSAYTSASQSAADPEVQVALRLRLGRVLSEELGKIPEALAEFRAVYDDYPENTEALASLELLYQKTEGWKELLEVYTRKLSLVSDPAERKATQFGIAKVQREQRKDVAAAIATFEDLLSEIPDDVDALAELDSLYGETKAWEKQVAVVRQRIDAAASDRELVELKFRLGELLETKLEDAPAALDCYREVLQLDLGHDGARAALAKLLDSEELRGQAAEILEMVFEQREEFESLAQVLEVRAECAEADAERVDFLRKLSQVQGGRLGNSEKAIEAQARALEVAPDNEEARVELEELAESSGALAKLSEVFARIAKGAPDPELGREYYMRLAALYERLGKIDAASAAYEKVLASEPGHVAAITALDALFRSSERFEDLAQVYRRRIELSSDPELTERLYAELAEVLEVKLGKPEEAVLAYQEVLATEPSSVRALAALDQLLSKLGRHAELAENLEAQLALAADDEAYIALTLRLASLRETKMNEVDAAIEGYREVLERDPTRPEALAALERLGLLPAHEAVIAEILEPLYRAGGEYKKLIGVYEVQVRLAKDVGRKVELLRAIQDLHEDAGSDENSAFDTAARSLAVDPAGEDALASLKRLAAQTGRFEDLARVLAELGEQVEDGELQSQLYFEAARVLEESVGDAARAIDGYKLVLAADPTRLDALEALQRLYKASERFAELSLALQKKSELLDDVDAQKEALFQAAQIEEDILERPEAAIGVYEKVLELDEEELRAIDSLVGLFLGLSRWPDLLRVYGKKVDLILDPEEKKQVLYEVGAVYERELSDVASAIDTYQKVLELDPDDLSALGRLDVLYQTAGNWAELLSVLTREAELTADPEEAVGFQYRVASLYEAKLDDAPRAIELYRELLGVQPDHAPTLGALERLQQGDKVPVLASEVLEQIYEAAGDAEKLVRALEVQVRHAEDTYAKVDLIVRVATLEEESLGSEERAFASYGRAVRLDATNESVLANYERLALAGERFASVVETYDAELERLEDEAFVALALRVAGLYETQLDKPETAIERYAAILEVEPENRSALVALDRLYSQTERWNDLVPVLARQAEIGETPDEILEFKVRLGDVRLTRLGDVNSAIEAYRDVLAAAPENDSARASLEKLFEKRVKTAQVAEILEPLYQSSGEWEKLLEVREGQLEAAASLDDKVLLLHRMAEEAESHLVDGDRAFGYLVRALALVPGGERTVDELERLAPNVESGWEKLADAYADVLAVSGLAPDVLAATGQRLAQVFERELSDLQKAEETYRFVLSSVPTDLVALENLDRIYTELERYVDLAAILERRGTAPLEDYERVEIYLRLGHLYEEKLALGVEGSSSPVASRPPISPRSAQALDEAADETTEVIEPSLDDLLPEEESVDSTAPDSTAPDSMSLDPSSIESTAGEITEVTEPDTTPGMVPSRARLEDAIRAYRVVFDGLQPDNDDAIQSLERVYEQTQQWKELDVVYQRELENAAGDAAEADVRAKRARLAAERLGNVDAAVEGWKRVLDLRGEDPEALRALASLYEQQGKWSELTDVLERHFDIADSDEDRVFVLLMRAKLFDEQLKRDDEALETYRRVVDIDYTNVTALRAIASLWRRRKDADELVQALRALVENGASQLDGSELVEGYREMAKLYAGELEQPFEAAEAWRSLLTVGPTDLEAMAALEAIYRSEENWEEVIGIKMQRAEALEEASEKVRELLEVTELWRVQAGDYSRATTAYERVLAAEPLHERAFKELEKLYSQAERWEQLVELYLNRLEHYEEVPPRSDLLRRIATVFEERLHDNNQAFDALVTAFSDDFFDEATSTYLERMAQATNRWNELLATANTWVQEEQDKRKQIKLCLLLGKWYGENLGMANYAMPYFQRVTQMDPQNVPVLRQMAALDRLNANYQKAGQGLQKALEVAVANEDRKAILSDLGDLLFRNMEQPEQAIPFYKRALEIDPGYLPALNALERIYDEKGLVPDLVEILTKKAAAIERPEEAVRQKLRLGGLLEEKVGDTQAAAKVYKEAVEIDPDSLPALRGLERMQSALADWPALVQTLERQLDVVTTQAERVAVLLRLAEIQEQQFLKADLAAARLEQALSIDTTQEGAYVALARCYRRLKQWNDLIATLQRHLEETSSRETKLELYAQIGATYRDELSELDLAIDAFQAIVDADDTNIPGLEALSKLFEKQGEAARAIDMMSRVADLTSDGAQQVEMYFRIGRAMEEKLSDRFGAREKFERALDIDPGHLPSLAALRTIAVDEADWDGACRYLEQEQARTETPRLRAKLLVELGRIRGEMLGDTEQALEAYAQAIELDDECEEAALPLVRSHVEGEKWAAAGPLIDMLVRKSKNRDRGEQHMLYKLQGQISAKLGEHEKSLKAYQAAHQLDLTDHETIVGIADAAFSLEDWPTALTNYQKVLTALGEEDADARRDVYYKLGAIKLAQGQDRQAINNYEKALAIDGEHRPSLEALVEVYAKGSDFKQVAEYKRQILDAIFDGEERFKLLLEIGDLWMEKEKNPKKALEAYEEARDLKPQDHILLHKMLQGYQSAEEWQKMVDIIDAIKDLEERPKVKSKLVYTQAQIYRDKLEDQGRAVELFNEALDLNPELLEAFERINKILTQEKNWKQLERSYRKMLHRIAGKGNPELEHNLWHQLGVIYRDRTGQVNEAIEAFKMSANLKEDAPLQRQILAELYENTERWDDAIKEQRRILRADPLAIEPYQALYRLYLHKRSYDEAWCLASAMSFMKKADAETERFFEDFRPKGMLPVAGRLGAEHWLKALVHPSESLYLSEIFRAIAPAALQAKLAQLKGQGKLPQLDERFRQDPNTSTVTFAKTFGWAAQVLGIPAPALYVRNDVQAYIGAVPSDPPASVAGQLVLSGFQPQELTFICGKHLASYRPEGYLKVLFPSKDELTVMLFAGVLIAAPQQPMPPDMEAQIRATAQALAAYMQPMQVEALRGVVKKFLADGAKANVKKWSQGVEHTALRAGLVLCCDLEIAKKIVGAESSAAGELSAADRLKELLLFAVSDEYSAIRRALGVAVPNE